MTERAFQGDFLDDPGTSRGPALDFKRILYRAIRYWYLVAGSLVAALSVAYLKNRYAQRIYPVSTSVIIREVQEVTGGEFIYSNALANQYRNYLNEPYILKSVPLIQKVVEDLGFSLNFQKEGRFLTSDAYDYLPVWGKVLGSIASAGPYEFVLLGDSSYRITSGAGAEFTFTLDDTASFEGNRIVLSRRPGFPLRNHINDPFRLNLADPFSIAGGYAGALTVSWAEEGAGVMNLSISGPNPLKNTDFLNRLVYRYQEYDLEKKNQAATRSIEFIGKQLDKISDSLRVFESALQHFKAKNVTTDLSAEALRLYQKLEALERQETELIVRKNYFDYLEKYIGSGNNLDKIILPTAVGLDDPILNGFLTKLIDLQLELRLNVSRETSGNPLLTEKQNRISEIRRNVLESVSTLRSTDKIKSDFIGGQIAGIEKQLGSLPASERVLVGIQRNYSLMENLYVYLMQKMAEAGITRASNTSDVVLVNPPARGGALAPKISQNYTIATILGLVFPFALFVLLELVNDKVQSKEDIEKFTTIPFIGGVGHNESSHSLVVKERPKSGIAESFRALRSNLNFFVQNQTGKIFMITSSISGEGKTFTTVNLASVFALSGRKTLIVGADMRRPKIYTDFGLNNEKGLSTYLSGLNSLNEVIQSTPIENLFLVSGGPVPPNPSELLMTDKLGVFCRDALKQFDYVIFDTPPLALVTDAFVISGQVDHTVFVVRQNFTSREFLRSIQDYYQEGKFKNTSILLNDIFKTGLGYGYGYGYQYGYAYKYGYGYGRRKNGNGYYED